MIDINRAIFLIKQAIPKGSIQKYTEYKNWYVFMIFTLDPFESEMDPFYSVDKTTGECCDFPYRDKQYFNDIMDLFKKADKYKDSLDTKVQSFLKAKNPFNKK